jgi:hypothetical protein
MEVKGTLEDYLKNIPAEKLKRGGDTFPFNSRYETFKSYLEHGLHSEVTTGAILAELRKAESFDKVIWLNDHGPKHIKTVIERASQLLDNSGKFELNPREVFILLNAIQVHDVGNFYGRAGHEKEVLTAIKNGLTPILFDNTEVQLIRDIAQVHGGKVKYKDGTSDKNTILTIKEESISDGYTIRQRVLASILRFADELADDKSRADVRTLNEGKLPKGSEIYHAYAACLDTVMIKHDQKMVALHFKVPKNYLMRTFGKLTSSNTLKNVYLLDEIFERAIKMHQERIYCAKFWKGNIDIEKIWVQVAFYANQVDEVLNLEELLPFPEITFTLHDSDYPSGKLNIYSLCPDLKFKNGTQIDGVTLKEELRKNQQKSKPKKSTVVKEKLQRHKNKKKKSKSRSAKIIK